MGDGRSMFRKTMMGVVTGYELVCPVVDPHTGELLDAQPVHTVELKDQSGYEATLRIELTADRRLADRAVGKMVCVTLEMSDG